MELIKTNVKKFPKYVVFYGYLKTIFIDRQINSNERCRENNCAAELFALI